MSIAITEDHCSLAETVRSFAEKRNLRGGARERLESSDDVLPEFWPELAGLGWLGLHLPEDLGGSGYGIDELVVVVEGLARAVAPGPFVPTVIASAVIAAAGDADLRSRLLPGLADGSTVGAVALGGSVTTSDGVASGDAGVVLGAGLASLILVAVGDDVVVVEVTAQGGDGVAIDSPPSLDPTRPSARVTLDNVPVTVMTGAHGVLVDLARVILSADAVGVARECTEMAAGYSKERIQFGRPIAMYQAVKHHCANMAVATELATSAVWDAARASATGGDQLTYAAAVAATLAAPAADLCANLNTQVHGGIAITWEHDAHLYMRRATTLLHYLDATGAAEDLTDLSRRGVAREKAVELPPEADAIRDEVRSFARSIKDLPDDEQRTRLIETGYVMPQWPKPYGRAAGAVEQLVIEQEFADAGVSRPGYGITAWNILTIIQYATQDQIDRWVRPALNQDVIWCQLFSEPDAGSDAAGVKTKATRVDGGWLVNGQKVWTSGAHVAGMGFATVRTNPDVPKHDGITMMAIDMHADGVEVRPLKMTSGNSEFNEVFFDDVFVPQDHLIGGLHQGWAVANTTLAHERGTTFPFKEQVVHEVYFEELLAMAEGSGAFEDELMADRLVDAYVRLRVLALYNLRTLTRLGRGETPGPESSIAKLVWSAMTQALSEVGLDLVGDAAPLWGDAADNPMRGKWQRQWLWAKAASIAGGTSEIQRTIIGDRILGLPRA